MLDLGGILLRLHFCSHQRSWNCSLPVSQEHDTACVHWYLGAAWGGKTGSRRLLLSEMTADVDSSPLLLMRAPAGSQPLAVLQGDTIHPNGPHRRAILKFWIVEKCKRTHSIGKDFYILTVAAEDFMYRHKCFKERYLAAAEEAKSWLKECCLNPWTTWKMQTRGNEWDMLILPWKKHLRQCQLAWKFGAFFFSERTWRLKNNVLTCYVHMKSLWRTQRKHSGRWGGAWHIHFSPGCLVRFFFLLILKHFFLEYCST